MKKKTEFSFGCESSRENESGRSGYTESDGNENSVGGFPIHATVTDCRHTQFRRHLLDFLRLLNLRQIAAVAVTQELASRTAGYDPALVGKDVLQAILDEIGQQAVGKSRAASVAASFATGVDRPIVN